MAIQEMITEKVITYIYQTYNKEKLQELEEQFLNKKEQLQQQFADWLVYDYSPEGGKSFGERYLSEMESQLTPGEANFLRNGITSYLGFYEIVKEKDKELYIKNLFTTEQSVIPKENIDEDVGLHEILLIRIGKGEVNKVLSTNVMLLPYQFKTMLVGQIIEDYEKAKKHRPYLSYGEYFKGNTRSVLEIINKLLSFENQEGNCTLFQGTYIVADYNAIKNFLDTKEAKFPKEDGEEGVYQVIKQGKIMALIVLQRNKLEIECNSQEQLFFVKELLEESLGQYLHHVKDEELTLDDLI